MAKPRVMIVDTDHSYIIPLQVKFIKDFFEKIDLEIVTDKMYFDALFIQPQKIDVLIISEDMYDPLLRKHDIGNIFIMTEQNEEEVTTELGVTRLHKYSSVKTIFQEVVGESAAVLDIDENDHREPQIILVYSACGGVGKTTVALGMSASLSKHYKKVLYISAERMHSFQYNLENPGAISDTKVYSALSETSGTIYEDIKHVVRKEHFYYVPPFKASLMSLGLQYSVYENLAIAAKRSLDYDFIVVDADTTFDEDKARLLDVADKVIIVTDQRGPSVFATDVLISNINGISSDKFIFVCNNFKQDEENALIAPNITIRFTPNEYINYFDHHQHMKIDDISTVADLQKTAFLVM